MRISRAGLAAVSVAAFAMIAPQLPASASTRATPAISIKATSKQRVVTRDVWVIFQGRSRARATIKGTVTGGTSGQVLRLYGRQWPFTKPAVRVGSPVTVTGGSQPYSFIATPTLATRYQAELFASASTSTPLAKSAIVTVFVVGNGSVRGIRPCGRPVCRQIVHLTLTVPRSTLRTEIAKRWFTYFGLNLSRTGEPPPPKFLHLGAGNGHASKTRKLNGTHFAVTLTFSFRIGNDGYFWLFNACTKDTEAKDGLNLPGHHGCGTLKVISSKRVYLG